MKKRKKEKPTKKEIEEMEIAEQEALGRSAEAERVRADEGIAEWERLGRPDWT